MTNCCAIIGCTPEVFPWGWDEEDETCAALKLLLVNRVTLLRSQGVARFHVSIDSGAGLYAAEIINSLRTTDSEVELHCYVPYEEQATKWTPELRDRYFNALSTCTDVVTVAYKRTVGCEFKAHLEAMMGADTVVVVYDPDDSHCEREAAAVTVAEVLSKQVVPIDPKTIRLF